MSPGCHWGHRGFPGQIFVKLEIHQLRLTCMKLCQASVSMNCDLRVERPGPGGTRSGDTELYDINIGNIEVFTSNLSLAIHL